MKNLSLSPESRLKISEIPVNPVELNKSIGGGYYGASFEVTLEKQEDVTTATLVYQGALKERIAFYGIKNVTEIAGGEPEGLLWLKDLSKNPFNSEEYTDDILRELVKAGIDKSDAELLAELYKDLSFVYSSEGRNEMIDIAVIPQNNGENPRILTRYHGINGTGSLNAFEYDMLEKE